MRNKGCKSFAELIVSQKTEEIFAQNVEGGLTVFCPGDDVLRPFLIKYKNLTADGKTSLLLYHGVPVYNSMGMLRSNNGPMNTLATEGANKYDFTIQNDGAGVMVKTKVVSATIKGTLVDEDPLAVYKIDKVLLPRELFKAEVAPAPKAPKGKKSDDDADAEAEGPGSSEDDGPADETASENGSVRISGVGMVLLTVFLGLTWVLA